MAELPHIVGKNIARWRVLRGLTQEMLAHLVGYTTGNNVSRIESGQQNISLSKLEEISEVLHVPVAKLLEESNSASGEKNWFEGLQGLDEEHREIIERLVSELSDLANLRRGRRAKPLRRRQGV